MASSTIRSPDDPTGAPPGAPEAGASADGVFGDATGDEVLLLDVAGTTCAIRSTCVREVVRGAPVTPLPGTAGWLCGVAAVGGAVLPVGDLRARHAAALGGERGGGAGEGTNAEGRAQWIVVLDDGRRVGAIVGARVHAVTPAERWPGDATDATDAPARAPAGLPVEGAVRLKEDVRTASGAGLLRIARTRRSASPARAVPAPAPSAPARPVPLLDVAALLDDLYDEGG